jgi:hypothetical protein
VNNENSNKMKKNLTGCATLVILLASLVLTACVHESSAVPESLVRSIMNQPPVLRLLPGQIVLTKDGTYKVSVDEIWHSDARFRVLEQENVDLRVALANKQ